MLSYERKPTRVQSFGSCLFNRDYSAAQLLVPLTSRPAVRQKVTLKSVGMFCVSLLICMDLSLSPIWKGSKQYWYINFYRPTTKYFVSQCSQLPKVSLCFWKEQRVDEDQYGVLVEWNWERKLKCGALVEWNWERKLKCGALVEWNWERKLKWWGRQCHSAHRTIDMVWGVIEHGPSRWEA
jgi:hypothetical protein